METRKRRPIILEIRKNDTGEIVKSEMDGAFAWDQADFYPGFNDFYFSEGNFSCDCNRLLEFERAKGTSEEDIEKMEYVCGDEHYSMNIYTPEGELLYEEFTK